MEIIGVWIGILLSIAIGIWVSIMTYSKNPTPKEHFTAKGYLDKKRIFFSVFATTFSAFTVVGLPAMYYAHGIGTFWFMWVGIALTPLTLIFIGKKIIRLSNKDDTYTTPIGLITSGYNSKAITTVLSVVTIIVLFPYFVLQIAGVGKFLISVSDGNIGYLLGTVICCLIVAPYIFTGGAKADAETDYIQGIILIIATFCIGIIISVIVFDNGIKEQVELLNEKQLLSIPGPNNYFSLPLLLSYGLIFTLISISTPQVSQKLMGIENVRDLKPLLIFYPIIGSIIVVFAGLIGLYAAINLEILSPDFATGEVLRSLKGIFDNKIFSVLFFIVTILFVSGIISAAVSTIDSLILAITGIVRDSSISISDKSKSFKVFSVFILLLGIIVAAKPPQLIVSLAQIQLAGLTALIPCLLGPLFKIRNKYSGWLSLIFGLAPLVLNKVFNIDYWGFDPGAICLITGIIGLLMGLLIVMVNSKADKHIE